MVHFSDDGALWEMGRNLEFLTDKIQEAILKVEKWANKWGVGWWWWEVQVFRQKICFLRERKFGGRLS